MSRSENLVILREASSAFSCLSSKEENKFEIVDCAISTIIALVLLGDDEAERYACCAHLLQFSEVHVRFLEEKGLPSHAFSNLMRACVTFFVGCFFQ